MGAGSPAAPAFARSLADAPAQGLSAPLATNPPTVVPPSGRFGLGLATTAHELPALRTRTSRTVVTAQGLRQTTISPGSWSSPGLVDSWH